MLGLFVRPPVLCVTCAVIDSAGRVLLGRSTKGLHLFQTPGGHVDAGETLEDAAARETCEEAGVAVRDTIVVRPLQRPRRGEVLIGCAAHYASGTPKDSDELSDVGFYTRTEIETLHAAGRLTWQTAELLDALSVKR